MFGRRRKLRGKPRERKKGERGRKYWRKCERDDLCYKGRQFFTCKLSMFGLNVKLSFQPLIFDIKWTICLFHLFFLSEILFFNY